jgi:hypothetical protein
MSRFRSSSGSNPVVSSKQPTTVTSTQSPACSTRSHHGVTRMLQRTASGSLCRFVAHYFAQRTLIETFSQFFITKSQIDATCAILITLYTHYTRARTYAGTRAPILSQTARVSRPGGCGRHPPRTFRRGRLAMDESPIPEHLHHQDAGRVGDDFQRHGCMRCASFVGHRSGAAPTQRSPWSICPHSRAPRALRTNPCTAA